MQETMDYLYSLKQFGIKLGLENMKRLMNALGNPQKSLSIIHIAGTNGKGSTVAFLDSCLQEAGYKVGLYTSPHLIRFNERIQINRQEITDEQITGYVEKIKTVAEKQKVPLTFFECATALAFLHFAQQEVDFAIIETGLGGRLDATNIVTPIVSIITRIGFDHMQHLGDSLGQITKEKAGIIKNSIPVITVSQDEEVMKELKEICEQKNSQLHVARITDHDLSLLGVHQQENAGLAIKTLEVLHIPFDEVALHNTHWPGRMQKIGNMLLDGAHNPTGMMCLRAFLQKEKRKKILILGIKEHKDVDQMLSIICPAVDEIILTEASYSATEVDVLEEVAKKYHRKVSKEANLQKALDLAQERTKEDKLIVVAGSLYLVGDVLAIIKYK